MKTCSKCNVEKPLTDFNKSRSQRDGLQALCKPCHRNFSSKWNKENRDKVLNYKAAYRESHRDELRAKKSIWREENKHLCRRHKSTRRARIAGVGGFLSGGIVIRLFKLQRGKCACCGLPLGKGFHLDHIMPLALGGSNTDDNMQLLRANCNLQKSAKHPIDFMQSKGFLL